MAKFLAAMSGGVDSSVMALLMLRQGHTVGGATMRLFSSEDIGLPPSGGCGSVDSIDDAKAVCDRLGIPHTVFHFEDEFRQCVMSHFAQSYQCGETPNPCIECNRHLKFRRFLQEALSRGYDGMATGHYARIAYDQTSKRYVLRKAADHSKDQSYVLYSLSQHELSHTLFPLGGMTKADIRALAAEQGFINANKPDSQDICFVPDGDYAAFLEHVMHVSLPAGDFVRDDGRIVGRHKGLHHYTIGQRKGLGIAAEQPLYVVKKDMASNRVILSDNSALFSSRLVARDVNWIAIKELTAPINITAKTRYAQTETPAVVHPLDNDRVLVEFESPQRAITAGQAVVFYDGDMVVGGGTITTED